MRNTPRGRGGGGARAPGGFTLVELVIVVAIVGILASAALPLARWSLKRSREIELQQALRVLRIAIDRYHDAAEAGLIEVPEGSSGYPASLDVLVEGVPLLGPMPPLMPPVADEYAASGAGLTGGLGAQLAQGQATVQASDAGPSSSSPVGRTSLFGARGTGSRATATATPGLRPGAFRLGGGAVGLRPGTAAGDAGQQQPQPLLGPDGQPVKVRFLRRIPVDPFTGKAEWGLRCYGDPPEDRLWCGRDVFDVYSKSPARAIDGTYYRDW